VRRASALVVSAILGVAGLAALPTPASAATDPAGTTVSVSAYKATIKRTSYDVPHIQAADIGSAAFGQGWAYAEDRFCDLMDMVIKDRSQRSRYFGAGPNGVNLVTDFAYADLGIQALAQQQNARLSTEERQILDGYVAGFNGFLNKTGAAKVPGWCKGMPWIGPITAVDVLAYQRDLALLGSADNFLAPIALAQPPTSAAQPLAASPSLTADGMRQAQELQSSSGQSLGSNGWGIGADRSQNGQGLLLANPHFPWQGELRFWESQLSVPNSLNVYGASLGGLPGVQIGFTNKVAWTHTIAAGSRYTFYSVDLVPGQPTKYLVDGVPEAMTSKTLNIQVKQSNGTLSTVSRTLYSTRYGPVLDLSGFDPSLGWSTTTAYTYRDANIDNDKMLHQWFDIARASDVNGIKAAINANQGIPWVNIIASDSAGNAYYADPSQTPALLPSAVAEWVATQPLGILNGSDSTNSWQTVPGARSPGLIPFSQQPQLQRRDYVFNANDSHWLANEYQLLTGYSPLQGFEGTPVTVRTRQNVALIDGREPGSTDAQLRFNLAGLQTAILGDSAFTSDQLTNAVVAACQARGTTPVVVDGTPVVLTAGCSALAAWDRRFDPNSSGSTLWRETIASVVDTYGQDALNQAGPLWGVPFNPADPAHTPRGAPADMNPLLNGLARAMKRLQSLGLPPNVKQSVVQYTEKNGTKIPVPGSNENVGIANAVYYSAQPGSSLEPVINGGQALAGTDLTTKGYVINYGTSFLLTLQFTPSGPSAKAVLTFSESADPASPYFSDQTRLFQNKQLRPVNFTDAQIAGDLKSTEALASLSVNK
jgi:acyl-homoserine-lactone acylase